MDKKDQQSKKSSRINQEFLGQIIEIHSGDSLSIKNLQKNQVNRYFLANIRAPQCQRKEDPGKPWGFEAKEFVRKSLIGKQVKVEIEFQREIPMKEDFSKKNEQDQKQTLVFVTVFINEKNFSVLLLEEGLAGVQTSYKQEDDSSNYLQDLQQAEEKAKQQKKGMHKGGQKTIPKFLDYTMEKSGSKAKQFFQFLDKEKPLNAVVELVLNGQRLKIRFADQNEFIMFQLNGIKCFQKDPNIKQYEELSAKALKLTKENLNQRDVVIYIDDCDKNGTFHGSLFLQKKNFACVLLEQGLAFCQNQGRVHSSYQKDLQSAEQQAKELKKGLWKENVELPDREMKSYQEMNETHQVLCTEFINSQEFYLQGVANKQLQTIDDKLKKLNSSSLVNIQFPAKKGTPCLAKFDDEWYRASIESQEKNGQCQVFFVDFGNTDYVDVETVKKMPQDLIGIPNQVRKCALAFIRTPYEGHQLENQVIDLLTDQMMEKKMQANFQYKDGQKYYVVLNFNDKPNQFINEQLLAKGFAKLDKNQKLKEQFQQWKNIESTAQDKKQGMWKYDDNEEQDDY